MEIEYDPAKNRWNIRKHGIDFDSALELLSGPHVMRHDARRDYGEQRFIAYGLVRDRMHVCVYTLRGNTYRIISLRKANGREIDAYGSYILQAG